MALECIRQCQHICHAIWHLSAFSHVTHLFDSLFISEGSKSTFAEPSSMLLNFYDPIKTATFHSA
jgi:hypothetical protein